MKITDPDVEAYAKAHSDPESALHAELADYTRAHTEFPQMMVGNLEGGLLAVFIRALNAKRVLEIGTFTGYSALWMASALPDDGQIIACDVNELTARVAREYWAKSPHGEKIDLRVAPALETLKTLEGPFDLVFIDADKSNYQNYWDAVIPMVRAGGLIIVDNVLWSGTVLNPEKDSAKAIAAFNDAMMDDPRVHRVMLTVRDGMLVAQKKAGA